MFIKIDKVKLGTGARVLVRAEGAEGSGLEGSGRVPVFVRHGGRDKGCGFPFAACRRLGQAGPGWLFPRA